MTPRNAPSRRRWHRADRKWAKRILGGHDIWKNVAADPRHVIPRNAGGAGCGIVGAAARRRGELARARWAQEARIAREIQEMAELLRLQELHSEDAQDFLSDLIAMGIK